MENMEIWNQVCTTNPANTKRIEQRGGFTAIDAMTQVQRATEIFGPFGFGWGVHTESFNFSGDNLIYTAILWYTLSSTSPIDTNSLKCEFPIHANLVLTTHTRKDCVKIVATDALTKGLSKLGFNADVFLGKFDDNKYVQEQRNKHIDIDKRDNPEPLMTEGQRSWLQQRAKIDGISPADFAKKYSLNKETTKDQAEAVINQLREETDE